MKENNIFEIAYEFGWFPGWIYYPLEFTNSQIIFYDRNKKRKFGINYIDIDYVWKVPLFLIWQIDILNWQLQIFLKRNILDEFSVEENKIITSWFPPCSITTPNIICFFTIYSPKRNVLIESFKKHNVTVSERFIHKKYWSTL